MSDYNLQPQGYPSSGAVRQAEAHGGHMAPPLPAPPNYPVKDGEGQNPAVNTQTRGHGFWRGCCAGLCCYCLLDACF